MMAVYSTGEETHDSVWYNSQYLLFVTLYVDAEKSDM